MSTKSNNVPNNWEDWDYMIPVGYNEETKTYGNLKEERLKFITEILIFIALLAVMGLLGIIL